jgi:sugar lactone lactonase YvrE
MPRITSIVPGRALPGARVDLHGAFDLVPGAPRVTAGAAPARVVWASATRLAVLLPGDAAAGPLPLRVAEVPGETPLVMVGTAIATGLHQVDSPAIGPDGAVYVTYSGGRGQTAPVSVYRVPPGGEREVFVTGITNATSLAFDARGRLHVSSRFDGTVARIDAEGRAEVVASELGVACGIAFDADGALYVGDRTGTVFQVAADGGVRPFATLPASMAAFHLVAAPGGGLYATGPTLSPRDAVYHVDAEGRVREISRVFGRPQGLAVDGTGRLYVAEALAGASGLYRLGDGDPELVVSGADVIGAAFGPRGELVVATADTAYRFEPTA